MRAKSMVRAERGRYRCCDCGRLLVADEALVCETCDRADLDALRALLAPPADAEHAEAT